MIDRELAQSHGELIHEKHEKERSLQTLKKKAQEIVGDLKKLIMMLEGKMNFDIGADYQIRDQGFQAVFHSKKEIHDVLVEREKLQNEILRLNNCIEKTSGR